MKVLLYEGRKTGHGPVWLQYTIDACVAAGVDYHLIDEVISPATGRTTYDELQDAAREHGCDLVHILTFDHFVREWLKIKRSLQCGTVPVIGTYFRFTSLWKFPRCLAWEILIRKGCLDGLLVPDPFLEERLLFPGIRSAVWHVPDAWRRESASTGRTVSFAEPGRTSVLIFGDISRRKGVPLFLKALAKLPQESRILGVLVGQMEPEIRSEMGDVIEHLVTAGRLRVFDQWTNEEEVLAWFESCDYVACPYPPDFEFSSGTFMRGCVCGKPVIVPAHGLLGKLVRRDRDGIVYESRSHRAMEALKQALLYAERIHRTAEYQEMSNRGRAYADGSEWASYAAALIKAYEGVLLRRA